ncbi:MAG: hypothetical protein H8E59_01830 [Actinobacteria bacterium]|nr:hypothetical protein [Actinomycetota bacterium]
MTEPSPTDLSPKAVARVHGITTMFHGFVYFSQEATEEYAAVGVEGAGGYFASRAAPLGPVSPEVVVATFYNFSPDLVRPAMEGVWDRVSPDDVQRARWRAVMRILDATVADAMTDAEVVEALGVAEACVSALSHAGRPLAAANASVLPLLEESEFAGNRLLRLWQLVTILREWRGDAHIGLLIAEPLDGCECTVVSEMLFHRPGIIRSTRAWPEPDWSLAVERLTARGWLDADGITEQGRSRRSEIERRTNELDAAAWKGMDDQAVHRFADLLKPANEALRAGGHFAAFDPDLPWKGDS